jgi:hypothetical protein
VFVRGSGDQAVRGLNLNTLSTIQLASLASLSSTATRQREILQGIEEALTASLVLREQTRVYFRNHDAAGTQGMSLCFHLLDEMDSGWDAQSMMQSESSR